MDNLEFFSFIHPILIYGVIFLGLALEGEIVLIAAGLLVYFGLLNYFFVLITVFFGLGWVIWPGIGAVKLLVPDILKNIAAGFF